MNEKEWNPNNLKAQQCEYIAFDETERFPVVERIDHGSNGRWHNLVEIIFLDTESNKHYKLSYNEAATEQQEHEFYNTECERVEQKEITVKKWVAVNGD